MAEEIIGKVDQNDKEEDVNIFQQEENAIEDEIESGNDQGEALETDKIELLQAEIDKLRQQSQEYLDGWQRERAEFANYKKRKEKESQLLQNNISGNIIRKYLDIVDDLERALQNQPEEGEGASWAKGIELIYRKFLSALEAEGVVPMKVKGQQFDPNLHEAISLEPNEEYESGQIIEVLRNGYLIGDRVIRPASVRIAQ
ncbi:MAG: nucleotide exchange factor GrpE [Anaerolineales bacterium]|jgi:molecular chaperone GrpE